MVHFGQYLRFTEPPREDHPLIREFVEHVRSTQLPEKFTGLHPGPFDPGEPFRRVLGFTVDPSKRPERDLVPCPMCGRQNKFKTGYLVCFSELAVLGVIGRECADPASQAASEADWKSRRRHVQEMDYLEGVLPQLPRRIIQVDRTRRAVAEAERVYRRLRKGGDWLKSLRRVAKEGGQFLIHEVMDTRASFGPAGIKSSGGSQTRLVYSGGLLAGSTATRTDFRPTATWDNINTYLREQSFHPGEDGLLERLIHLDQTPLDRGAAFARLRWAEKQWKKLRQELLDFVQFFDQLNLQRINAWASHPLNALGWTCRTQQLDNGQTLFAVESRSKPLVRVVIEPALWDWDHPWT
jgi:hypothetical protein